MTSRKTVGLVLGSGASRGWAHIGVIEALKEAGIPIDIVAGCSVGGYIGALYACGSIYKLKKFLLDMDGRKVFSFLDVIFSRSALFNGSKRLQELFSAHTDVTTFEELNIPLVMMATDLDRGDKVALSSGNLIDALRATMSYPGLFAPVLNKGRWLVDGGLIDPVPVGVARVMGATTIIAVDLNSRKSSYDSSLIETTDNTERHMPNSLSGPKSILQKDLIQKMLHSQEKPETKGKEALDEAPIPPDIVETVMTSISIMQERITRINLAVDRPDILIQPRLGGMKMMYFDNVEQTIQEGKLRTEEKIEDIKKLLKM